MSTPDYLENIDPETNYLGDFLHTVQSNYHTVQDYKTIVQSSMNVLTLVNYNIRSFIQNSDNFLPIFGDCMPQTLIFSETWFNKNFQASIPNYNAYHTVRDGRHSGGISVYVSDLYHSSIIQRLSFINENIEVCVVEATAHGKKILIVAVYRPHCGTIECFTEEIEKILQDDVFGNRRCIAAGDFNINLALETSSVVNFSSFLQSYHFQPIITKPTRFPPNDSCSPSLLDHIWYNSLDVINTGIISYDLTDHCPTFMQIPFNVVNNPNNEGIKISFRLNNSNNRELFSQRLWQFDWNSLVAEDLNLYVSNFISSLNNIYQQNFPMKTKIISKKKAKNPWFSSDLEKLVQQKSTYFELFRVGAITKDENNRFENKVKYFISKAKTSY